MAPSRYNLFVKNQFKDETIRALPHKQRLKEISRRWKIEKSKLKTGRKKPEKLKEAIIESRIPLHEKKIIDKLQASAKSKDIPIIPFTGKKKATKKCPDSTAPLPGEKHAVGLSGKKKGCRHSYTGPQTNLKTRLARGDKPISDIDRASKQHDIAYAKLAKKKFVSKRDVREVDDEYIRKIAKTISDPALKIVIMKVFKLKAFAEDMGILNYKKFL
jgi:hypothetical protein